MVAQRGSHQREGAREGGRERGREGWRDGVRINSEEAWLLTRADNTGQQLHTHLDPEATSVLLENNF